MFCSKMHVYPPSEYVDKKSIIWLIDMIFYSFSYSAERTYLSDNPSTKVKLYGIKYNYIYTTS